MEKQKLAQKLKILDASGEEQQESPAVSNTAVDTGGHNRAGGPGNVHCEAVDPHRIAAVFATAAKVAVRSGETNHLPLQEDLPAVAYVRVNDTGGTGGSEGLGSCDELIDDPLDDHNVNPCWSEASRRSTPRIRGRIRATQGIFLGWIL